MATSDLVRTSALEGAIQAATTLPILTDGPVIVGPPQGQWTHDDWETLLDHGQGIRYEIIDGALYMTTAPSSFHQWIIRHLDRHLGIPAEDQGLAFSFSAPVGVIMQGCDPVQPDFVVVLAPNSAIIRNRRIMGAPDLLIEVLSPSNAPYDRRVKLLAYATAGVPEYAIVDPAARELVHYRRNARGRYDAPRTYTAADTVTFDCLPGIAVTVGDLFAGAPDTTL